MFLKKIKKILDKRSKMCYNNYRNQERKEIKIMCIYFYDETTIEEIEKACEGKEILSLEWNDTYLTLITI